ncbi:MAG: DUF3450 domain-containing protein [Myxococcota bacterium]|nr:DUF3450 domain-containing protein [Myxococcota bacterium]
MPHSGPGSTGGLGLRTERPAGGHRDPGRGRWGPVSWPPPRDGRSSSAGGPLPLRSLRRTRALLLVAVAAASAGRAPAQRLESAMEAERAAHAEAAASQERVDGLADETQSLLDQYRAELRQIESLETYHEQLEQLVESQRAEIGELGDEIERVAAIEREIMPFMSRMIDTLGRFVESDVPFLLEERRARVETLRALLLRSDVSVAEKYRRLMEAWQIEDDFGHTVDAYSGELDLDAERRTVDFLRVGRLALFYRTLDGAQSGVWNGRAFEAIDGRFEPHVKRGLAIARRRAPPALLLLPVGSPARDGAE